MSDSQTLKIIARIKSDFPTKFGIPRQSGLAPKLSAKIVFEHDFRSPEALTGLENFSHIWLIWGFSEAARESWSPTVRPPRLGGNRKVGVFATRSPFRPNSLALSAVKIEKIENGEIFISGADLMDGTPIYDIKPYLPAVDAITSATDLFDKTAEKEPLEVVIPTEFTDKIPAEKLKALQEILSLDPRPAYQNDSSRIYGFQFAGCEIKFKVEEKTLTVVSVRNKNSD
ncbi:tRNA (N6-threonylcarbamoyladenosine(37)-N6)-methyltransferase TrmO [bacterium]|nr:tRNA (N6-threonylcarbamoyladenosine(37)-N6)-methyltransferase TrmO [bacterium]MBQ4438550.1 tRNA (N6-threonylcarbamoyladenosine(37)-N6)-methyltransferase TrmO [bacterium]